MVDLICDYYAKELEDRPVRSQVEVRRRKHAEEQLDRVACSTASARVQIGYLQNRQASQAPETGQQLADILQDVHTQILPGQQYLNCLAHLSCCSAMSRLAHVRLLLLRAQTSPSLCNNVAGVTHWQSPKFFAYYPANFSFPSLLGDMLSGALNMIGFSWISSPACTELETVLALRSPLVFSLC